MKLTIELVPQSSYFNNVRSILTTSQWDKIRKQVYKKANYICEICLNSNSSLEAHEIWEYNDSSYIQKLIGLIGLCKNCHQVKHIGLAQLQGFATKARNHLSKVNKISKDEAEKYIEDCFKLWNKRSLKSWQVDISYLKDNFNIDTSKVK